MLLLLRAQILSLIRELGSHKLYHTKNCTTQFSYYMHYDKGKSIQDWFSFYSSPKNIK